MNGWQEMTLREAGIALIDCDHRTPPHADTGYPYIAIPQLKHGRLALSDVRRITQNHFAEWTRKAKPQHNDVILSRRCNPGETAHVPAGLECALGQNLVLLRSNGSNVFPPFLRWLVRGPEWWEQIGKFINVGAVFDSLKCADIPNFELPIPPLPTQRAIASVLGALDDNIELNRRMNETLEALAQSLFKAWFVDPTQDGLPKGWREGTLGEITGFLGGYAFKSRDWIELGVPVVKIGSVKPGIVDLNEVSYVSDKVAEEAKRFLLSAGDLLIGMTGYVGEVGLVPPTENPPLLNQRVGKFVLEKPGTSALGFLYCLTRTPEFKGNVEVKSHGTAQANVSADGILSVPIIVPPKTLMEEFNGLCESILNRILVNHAESRTLAALRDALLPKLLSGEMRIKGTHP